MTQARARGRRGRAAGGLLVGAALVAAACSGGNGDATVDRAAAATSSVPPSTERVAPAPPSTSEAIAAAPASTPPAVEPACAILSPTSGLFTAGGDAGVPAELVALLTEQSVSGPEAIRTDLASMVADLPALQEAAAKGEEPAEGPVVEAARRFMSSSERVLDWTAEHCDEGPYWACLTRSSMSSVGPPTTDDVGQFPSADAALAGIRAEGGSVELTRTDALVEVGLLDERGRVTSSVRVERQGTTWSTTRTTRCRNR